VVSLNCLRAIRPATIDNLDVPDLFAR